MKGVVPRWRMSMAMVAGRAVHEKTVKAHKGEGRRRGKRKWEHELQGASRKDALKWIFLIWGVLFERILIKGTAN